MPRKSIWPRARPVKPRDVPLEPRATIADVLAGRASVVGSRTRVGRDDLGLIPGMVSPYEIRQLQGLRYGDPPIEESRYEKTRSRSGDAALLLRWSIARILPRPSPVAVDPNGRRPRARIVCVDVDALDTEETVHLVIAWLREWRAGRVFFVHPHAVNLASRDPDLCETINKASLVLPDGIGLRVAASLLGANLPANVNGTDLVPELLIELATEQISVALIGGAPGVATKAASEWRKKAPFRLLGAWDGYQTPAQYEEIAKTIQAGAPCCVLIAFGSPLQERFAQKYFADAPGVVAITVGGLFDFASGDKPRAPLAWRELGLEWVWRLVHEPRRLAYRYLVGNPEFLLRTLVQRAKRRRT